MKKSRKGLSLFIVLLMMFSVFTYQGFGNTAYAQGTGAGQTISNDRTDEAVNAPNPFGAVKNDLLAAAGEKARSEKTSITLSDNRVSLSAAREIDVTVSLGYAPDLNNLQWTIGGKPLSDWKKYNFTTKAYDGEPFITFSKAPALDGKIIKAAIRFDLPYGTEDLNKGARRLYPALIGYYDLVLKDTSTDDSLSQTLKFNAYDSYHKYDDIKPEIDRITSAAKGGRYIEYKSLGKTVESRDAHFVILAKNKAAVDEYLNVTMPLMSKDPKALQDMLNKGRLKNYKVPMWFNNIHPDEAPGIDAILELFDKFATQDKVTYQTAEASEIPKTSESSGTHVEDMADASTVTVDVSKALDNIIFLFNFTENPDGRYNNVRTNANGFDINRDNVYQTQVEARMTTSEIIRWKPLSFLDFHGFVSGFCIEPCTTPHDPNFEYDLLIDNMVQQAHLMGNAGVANTKYTNYEIPFEDYAGGWDDAVPSYTAVFAMALGGLGHTIEIPELNEDSKDALVAAGLASVNFVMGNKDRLFNNQLEYFRRGIEGIDAKDKVDPWMLNSAGEQIGRPRGEHDNFFPEYYVIPVDKSVQKNSLEAYKMVQYLLRDGVKVGISKEAVTIDQTVYPEGSYVVDMHQILRGYANEVLYDGYDVSDFAEMYAEIVNVFPDTRGFDRYAVWQPGAFDKKLKSEESIVIPATKVAENSKMYVIGNTNNDAVRAVNELLKAGSSVEMLKETGKDYSKGDFVVSREAIDIVKDKYLLDVSAYNGNSETMALTLPKVAAPSATGHLTFALKELGFDVVSAAGDGNVIVTDSSVNVKANIDSGKPYVGIGGSAMSFLKNNIFTTGFNYINSGYEGLMRANVAQDSMVTSGYAPNTIIYDAKGAYIVSVPEGANVLTTISAGDDYFKAGWWPDTVIYKGVDNGKLLSKGKPLAITAKTGNANITVFANNLVNKGHPQNDWRMLANAIFYSVSDN